MNRDLLASVRTDAAFTFLIPALDPSLASLAISRALARFLEVIAVRVTRHKKGRRCVIEYDVRAPGSSPTSLVGKVRVKGADQRTFGVLKVLWSHGFDENAPDGIHVPQPMGILPEYRMLLSASAPGRPATGLLKSTDGVLARRIAAVAWKLHRTAVQTDRAHTIEDELSILRDRFSQTALIHPEFSDRLDSLFERCQRRAAALARVNPIGIHRDFYPAQVLIDGDRCWLLDLDLYSLGDPALDIGNFLGHLTEEALRTAGNPDTFSEAEEALQGEYLALSGGVTTAEAIQTYRWLTLARHIYISTLFSERRHTTARLLEYCEQRL